MTLDLDAGPRMPRSGRRTTWPVDGGVPPRRPARSRPTPPSRVRAEPPTALMADALRERASTPPATRPRRALRRLSAPCVRERSLAARLASPPVHSGTGSWESPRRSSTRATVWATMSSTVCGLLVERRHRREHDPAHLREGQHLAEVPDVQRRLAHEGEERPALLERHVPGPGDQGVGVAARERGERLDRAGRDDHAGRAERAAGDRGADVAVVVDEVGQRLDLRARV